MSGQAIRNDPTFRPGRQIPWWLFAAVLGVAAAIAAGSIALQGANEEGLLHITRYTAGFAFLIFVVVFAAGALGALTSWFVAIGEMPETVTIIGGGLAYFFIALLALTSNDWSVRKLGPKVWRRLHLTGVAYVWLIFMNSYLARLASETPPEPRVIFAITAGLGFLALGLRITAWAARRRSRSRALVG